MMAKYVVVLMILLGFVHLGNCAKWTGRFKVYLVQHMQTAAMTCEIDGIFDGFYDKTGAKISDSDKYKIVKDTAPNQITLEVIKVEEADYGDYKCKDATSEDEASLEIDIQLEQPKPQSLAIGHEGKIEAEVYGMPRKPIKWSLGGTGVASIDSAGKMTLNEKDRYQIDSRGSLIIKKVVKEDAGTYTIAVSKDGSRIERTVAIDVGLKPTIKEAPEASYTKTADQELKLLCSWEGNSKDPEWTFVKKGSNTSVNIDAGKVDQSGYTIAAVSADDEGNYTCSAENKYGKSTVTTKISQIITPASITTEFKDTKQNIGSSFEVLCEADGTPAADVKIFYEGKIVASGTSKATITIVIAKENVGNYKCTADNGATTVDGASMAVEKKMFIEMLKPPMFLAESTKDVRSAVGLEILVECMASGNPVPTITMVQDGSPLAVLTKKGNESIAATYKVAKAQKSNFAADIICTAENPLGKKNNTIKLMEVVKANAPTGLKQSGPAGLKYIGLSWEKSIGAEKYIIYVNDTKKKHFNTEKTEFTIQNLEQNTYYSFNVASVNLAGEGNRSSIILKTSDIKPPGIVENIQDSDLTATAVLIRWDPPTDIEGMDILYSVKYCKMNNGTEVKPCETRKDQKDNSIQLADLDYGTTYQVTIAALNQKLPGESQTFSFTTDNEKPTPVPAPTDKKEGMSTGAIAGIIIAIILIILLVVDLFCCFFNHCGFSHCCVETFCASKATKYQPTETNEKVEEVEELKPKKESIEDVV